jgi:hypothetical protein
VLAQGAGACKKVAASRGLVNGVSKQDWPISAWPEEEEVEEELVVVEQQQRRRQQLVVAGLEEQEEERQRLPRRHRGMGLLVPPGTR